MAKVSVNMLMIEDDPVFAASFLGMIEASPLFLYRPTLVTTMADAFEVISKQSFDLIVLDLILPNGEGTKLVRSIRESAPATPIVVVTGLEDEEIVVASLLESATEVAFKRDLNKNPLLATIVLRWALARHKAMRDCQPTKEKLQIVVDNAAIASEIKNRLGQLLEAPLLEAEKHD